MSGRCHRPRRVAVGMAFFALFFQLFLPVALAAAADAGAPNRVLEICSIDGTRLIQFDDQGHASDEGIQTAEICTLCLVHAGFAIGKDTIAELLPPTLGAIGGVRKPTPDHPRAFISSDLTARGPPLG